MTENRDRRDPIVEKQADKDVLRARQRMLLYDSLEPRHSLLLPILFPKSKSIQYSSEPRPKDSGDVDPNVKYKEDILSLVSPLDFETSKGGGYEVLFRLLCTAHTPVELSNIFRGIHTLTSIKEDTRTEERIYGSYYNFIKKTRETYRTTFSPTEQTRFIGEEADRWCESYQERDNLEQFADTFYNKITPEDYTKKRPYIVESFLYLLLNPNYSEGWSIRMMEKMQAFTFATHDTGQAPESIFARDTSYWSAVDGTWAGMDISKQAEPETEILASELTDDERTELSRLRLERDSYRRKVQEIRSQKAAIELQLTHMRIEAGRNYQTVTNLRQQNERLREENVERLREIAGLRRAVGSPGILAGQRYREEMATDPFIRKLGYTNEVLASLGRKERGRVVSFLRREAGREFHPDKGGSSGEQRLKELNELFDKLEK